MLSLGVDGTYAVSYVLGGREGSVEEKYIHPELVLGERERDYQLCDISRPIYNQSKYNDHYLVRREEQEEGGESGHGRLGQEQEEEEQATSTTQKGGFRGGEQVGFNEQ